jgi:hypothetical protein
LAVLEALLNPESNVDRMLIGCGGAVDEPREI